MSNICREYCLTHDHPCFAGHFPDNPIVPAVIILDHMRELLTEWQPHYRIKTIIHMKFLSPLRPGQTFIINLALEATTLKFQCIHSAQPIVKGRCLLELKQ